MAKAISDAMDRLGIKQEDLAARIGRDQTTVSAWKRGKSMPPPELLLRLESLLQLPQGTLTAIRLDGQQPPEQPSETKRRLALDKIKEIRELLRTVEDVLRER